MTTEFIVAILAIIAILLCGWRLIKASERLASLPTVRTDPATEVGTVSATLNGTLGDDGGEACA